MFKNIFRRGKKNNSLAKFQSEVKSISGGTMPKTGNFGGGEVAYIGQGKKAGSFDPNPQYTRVGNMDTDYENILPQVNSADATLTIVVSNSSTTLTQAVKLFQAFENAINGVTNFGNPAGISVVCQESSYGRLMEETKSAPKFVDGVRIAFTTAGQVSQRLSLVQRTSQGAETRFPLQPTRYANPKYFNGLVVDVPNMQYAISGDSSIEFNILPNETVTFTFSIRTQVDMTMALKGVPVVKIADSQNFANQ